MYQRAMQNQTLSPEQYYLNTGCSVNELAEQYGISSYDAGKFINDAIVIAKHQRKLELCIQSGEDLVPELDIANFNPVYK